MNIKLNDTEQKMFGLLMQVVHDKTPGTILRAAGGWVRDKLLGKESQDIDIAVNNISGVAFATLTRDWMLEHNIPLDSDMYVIKENPEKSKNIETTNLRILGVPVDFAQLRKETYTEVSRIPTIQTNVSAHDDALRRDFTINSMFYNINISTIEDFTGHGAEDLEKGILRAPIDPVIMFLQDPLRILRAIRFASKYGFKLDDYLQSYEIACA